MANSKKKRTKISNEEIIAQEVENTNDVSIHELQEGIKSNLDIEKEKIMDAGYETTAPAKEVKKCVICGDVAYKSANGKPVCRNKECAIKALRR
jgi:hypothetical protein